MTKKREKTERACDECQVIYMPGNSLSRYCSQACQQRAWRRARPGYQAAATKKSLQADPGRQKRRRAYMSEYRRRPKVIERQRASANARYRRNPIPARERAKRHYDRISRFLSAVKETCGCIDCGLRTGLLHFDHRPGTTKHIDPSSARSLRAAIAEIAKCDVRCASCHARRHQAAKRAAA